MANDFSKLKEVLSTSPDARATLKIFKESGVVSEVQATELEQTVQVQEEALASNLSLDEILSALVDEDCLDIAERLHRVLVEGGDDV